LVGVRRNEAEEGRRNDKKDGARESVLRTNERRREQQPRMVKPRRKWEEKKEGREVQQGMFY
jgi:hypothetical protein